MMVPIDMLFQVPRMVYLRLLAVLSSSSVRRRDDFLSQETAMTFPAVMVRLNVISNVSPDAPGRCQEFPLHSKACIGPKPTSSAVASSRSGAITWPMSLLRTIWKFPPEWTNSTSVVQVSPTLVIGARVQHVQSAMMEYELGTACSGLGTSESFSQDTDLYFPLMRNWILYFCPISPMSELVSASELPSAGRPPSLAAESAKAWRSFWRSSSTNPWYATTHSLRPSIRQFMP
mmetsp:Transcript_23391/g.49819  ORF Transcript_23391/g.49819 Transcript_23391/m.49819 type:complete len:232 (-) Transcript_23391:1242-1937(-)